MRKQKDDNIGAVETTAASRAGTSRKTKQKVHSVRSIKVPLSSRTECLKDNNFIKSIPHLVMGKKKKKKAALLWKRLFNLSMSMKLKKIYLQGKVDKKKSGQEEVT